MNSRQLLLFVLLLAVPVSAEPIVYPYLQNPTQHGVDLYWVDTNPNPVEVTWLKMKTASRSIPAPELRFQEQEEKEFPQVRSSATRFLHRVSLTGLSPSQEVEYMVHFPERPFRERFKALPTERSKVRLIAYADSETEPESTGKLAKWGTREQPDRKYLIDQTTGYRENLKTIRERQPNAILIAGDLVESGGEQRDWDEFWDQNKMIAGAIPLLPAPGNHEYWAGPRHGRYSKSGSRWAIDKYRTYFHPVGKERGSHYYRKDIGPATLLSLDSGDGLPHGGSGDSNHFLEAAGDFAPDYHPGSEQWNWLEKELGEAQRAGQFTIVMFHHCPYSSGTHGSEPGTGEGKDEQSGQPLRALTPLLMRYGVDLVLSGHDEMFERSEVEGFEITADGRQQKHIVQVYDVGIGGDGLRDPERNNEYSKFLAFHHSPEQWHLDQIVSGGRHYGHLEIDVEPTENGWKATLNPVYILPIKEGADWSFERRLYSDSLVIYQKH
jgi:Calcineurin-like phosphoesterase